MIRPLEPLPCHPRLDSVGESLLSPPHHREAERLAALDGIRGIAILMVVFWHYYACVPRPEWVTTIPLFEQAAAYAWTGVPLFFVLSGFLIGRILITQRGRPGYYRVFFVRRAARILPLYFVALAAFATTRASFPPAAHPELARLLDTDASIWTHAAFLQNFIMAQQHTLGGEWLSVTWSLAVEEQFYLLLPFVVAVVRPALLPHTLVALIGFAIAFRAFALGSGLATPTAAIVLLPSRIDAFAVGILIATQLTHPVRPALSRWIAAPGFLIGGWAVYWWRDSGSLAYSSAVFSVIAGTFALGVWHAVSSPSGRASRLVAARPLVWAGSVSYFVYLFHQPANYLVHFVLGSGAPNLADARALAFTGLAFALVLVAGEVSRRWFEGPIVAFGKRCTYAPASPPQTPRTPARPERIQSV